MNGYARRVAALEAEPGSTAGNDAHRAAAQFNALLAGYARWADVLRQMGNRTIVHTHGQPSPSPQELLARTAMREAEAAGAWGTQAYATRFQETAARLLRERLHG